MQRNHPFDTLMSPVGRHYVVPREPRIRTVRGSEGGHGPANIRGAQTHGFPKAIAAKGGVAGAKGKLELMPRLCQNEVTDVGGFTLPLCEAIARPKPMVAGRRCQCP